MKKIVFLFFLIQISIFSATIVGKVSVYTGENYGVFIFVDNGSKYDVSDSNGEFELSGLDKGKEYTIVFQKENFPEIRKRVKISSEKEYVNVQIKKDGITGTANIYSNEDKKRKKEKKRIESKKEKNYVIGKVIGKEGKNIFVKLQKNSQGIVIKNGGQFTIETGLGKNILEFYVDGEKKREIRYNAVKGKNNLGDIKIEINDNILLSLYFGKEIDGVAYLYKDGVIRYSQRVEKAEKAIFKDIEKGNYEVKVVSYGNSEYSDKVDIEKSMDIKTEVNTAEEKGNLYIYLSPDDVPMNIEILKDGSAIKKIIGVQGLYIAEGLDSDGVYNIKVSASKYISQEARAIKSGEKTNVVLERDIKGAIVSGIVYPFSADAEVMLLDEDKILARTKTNEDGYYELETDTIKSGRKTIRVNALGYKEVKEIRTINENKETKNVNIALTPLSANFFGTVNSGDKNLQSGVIVSIDDLNLWQLTDINGKFYFSNIPSGKYNITFRKAGYKEIKKEIELNKNSAKEINIDLIPVGKVVINANKDGYTLNINGNDIFVKEYMFVSEVPIGKTKITASKDGYLNEIREIEALEPGQIVDITFQFRNQKEYKEYLEGKLREIRELTDGLYLFQAEQKINQFKSLEGNEAYSFEIETLLKRIKDAKGNLFDSDREVLNVLEKIKKDVELTEKENISYGEKRKKLGEKYRETLDLLEKIVSEKKYTSYKYEIYTMKSELYEKMGMPSSAKEAKETAIKYRAEQQRKR